MDGIMWVKRSLNWFIKLRMAYLSCVRNNSIPNLGQRSKNTQIGVPFSVTNPQNVYLAEYTRINPDAKIITYTGKFIVKKYSAIAVGCTVITGNHTPTVGIPHYFLGHSHINDKEKDVIVEEDVWIGANVTLLSGCHLGRGCVVGACSLVNKEIPPYAVVVGAPAHIIASKFNIEQILRHEEKLYPQEERFSRKYLENLFAVYYKNVRSIGVDSASL